MKILLLPFLCITTISTAQQNVGIFKPDSVKNELRALMMIEMLCLLQ